MGEFVGFGWVGEVILFWEFLFLCFEFGVFVDEEVVYCCWFFGVVCGYGFVDGLFFVVGVVWWSWVVGGNCVLV